MITLIFIALILGLLTGGLIGFTRGFFRGGEVVRQFTLRAQEAKKVVTTASDWGYQHPTPGLEFEKVYRQEYAGEIDSCDRWISWCQNQRPEDTHGTNFHQGMRAALVFHNIKMEQLLRVLKQQSPNVRKSPVDLAGAGRFG